MAKMLLRLFIQVLSLEHKLRYISDIKEIVHMSGVTCERQLNALNISKNTKHVNVIVVSRGVILLSLI